MSKPSASQPLEGGASTGSFRIGAAEDELRAPRAMRAMRNRPSRWMALLVFLLLLALAAWGLYALLRR